MISDYTPTCMDNIFCWDQNIRPSYYFAKLAYEATKAGHFWKFCSRVLEINFGRDSRVSKIAFTEKILHTLHDFQLGLPAYQCEPDRHSTQSQTTLFRPTIQNAVIPSI